MVYLMFTGWVPPEKGRAFGKAVLEGLKKYPGDESISKLILQAVTTDDYGIKAFSISEVKKGQMSKAMSNSSELAIFYAESIGPGFKYKIETLMSAVEAMKVIGLDLPQEVPEIY